MPEGSPSSEKPYCCESVGIPATVAQHQWRADGCKAYGNGVQQALLKLETVRKVLRENYRLQCEYEQFNTISHLLQDWDIEILEQQFSEKIVLRWAVNPAQVEQIQDSLTQRFAGRLVLEKEE